MIATSNPKSRPPNAAVPAKRIRQLEVGQSATISWGDEAAPQTLAGKVTYVGQEIEPGSGSFPVSIVAENPDVDLASLRGNLLLYRPKMTR